MYNCLCVEYGINKTSGFARHFNFLWEVVQMNKFFAGFIFALSFSCGAQAGAVKPSDVTYDVAIYDLTSKEAVYEAKIPGFMVAAGNASLLSDYNDSTDVRAANVNLNFLPRAMGQDQVTTGIGGNIQISGKQDSLPMGYRVIKFPVQNFTFKDGYSYVTTVQDVDGRKYRLVVNANVRM